VAETKKLQTAEGQAVTRMRMNSSRNSLGRKLKKLTGGAIFKGGAGALLVGDTFKAGGNTPGGGPLGGCQLFLGAELVDDSGGGTESERTPEDPGGAPEVLTDVIDRLLRLAALKGDSICSGLEWIKPLFTGVSGPSAFVGMRECDKLTGRVSPRMGGESFRLGVGVGADSGGGVCTGSGGRRFVLDVDPN